MGIRQASRRRTTVVDDRGRPAAPARTSSVARPGGAEAAAAPNVDARTRRVAAIVGGGAAVLAAPIFLATVATGGLRQPGFDQWSSFVSELGASGSPAALLTNIGFAAVGVCLAAFAVGMLVALPDQRAIGGLLVVPAVAFVILAASPCSAGCPIALVDAAATPADAVHNAAATAGLVALALAGLQMADWAPAGFGPGWYPTFSAVAGALVGLSGALFGLAVLAHQDTAIAVSERIMLAAAMAWNTVTGWLLARYGVRPSAQ